MAEIIFGIDHGNGNMKGENVCFPCGLVRYVSEPGRFMNEDILEYQGTYYTLSDTKMPFKADKTVDDDYFILTLYALAMEARNKGITLTGKDVVLGVGLPPADYGQQATSFKKYFLDHAKHGISFKMNGKSVNFYLKDVFVSPQNFAAVMNYHSHKNRDEVWVVISGEGKTIVDGMEQMVKPGDVITMSAGCRHTVIADTELKLIEVQLGADINVHDKQKFELEQ